MLRRPCDTGDDNSGLIVAVNRNTTTRMLRETALVACILLSTVSGQRSLCATEPSNDNDTPSLLSADKTSRFLHDVADKLGSIRTLRAEFLQQRHMTAFVHTLTARGVCHFRSPSNLRWELLEPYPSALVYSGGQVAKFACIDGKSRRIDSPDEALMGEVLRLITLWMTGQFQSTEHIFDMTVHRHTRTVPRLVPSSSDVRRLIHSVDVISDLPSSGTGRLLIPPYGSLLIHEDCTVTHFPHVSARRHADAKELDKILETISAQAPLWLKGTLTAATPTFTVEASAYSHYALSLSPRDPAMRRFITSITLTMDADSYHIRRVTIHEPRGDTIVITFMNPTTGIALNDSLFTLD